MKPEVRDQIIQGLLGTFAHIGAEDYDEAMKMLERGAVRFLEGVRMMGSVDKLRELLDEMEPDEAQEKILLGAVKSAPALVGMFIRYAGEMAEADLPRQGAGRPAIDFFKREQILDFIVSKMRAGCSLRQAKARAAINFQSSSATIQRIWNERASGNTPDAAALFRALQDGTLRESFIATKNG